LKRSARG